MNLFTEAIIITLKHEDPELQGVITTDTGGVTKFGISSKAYPELDVRLITLQDAIKLYKKDYWDRMNIDGLTDHNSANVIFDFGVNAGVKKAIKTAQQVVGVLQDGIIGPKSIKAINSCENFVNLYTDLRVKYYTDLAVAKKYKKYLKGWLRRANSYRV